MKAIIQRVQNASILVNDEMVSQIGKGLCVLIGISRHDKTEDSDYIVRKILNIRLFDGSDGKRWHSSVVDNNYEILSVSQFTLYSTLKGNKPDFHEAMDSSKSLEFYNQFLHKLRTSYKPELVKDGVFGAYMKVNIENDGPVSITLESPRSKTSQMADDSK